MLFSHRFRAGAPHTEEGGGGEGGGLGGREGGGVSGDDGTAFFPALAAKSHAVKQHNDPVFLGTNHTSPQLRFMYLQPARRVGGRWLKEP